jgi:hypothetical protein
MCPSGRLVSDEAAWDLFDDGLLSMVQSPRLLAWLAMNAEPPGYIATSTISTLRLLRATTLRQVSTPVGMYRLATNVATRGLTQEAHEASYVLRRAASTR